MLFSNFVRRSSYLVWGGVFFDRFLKGLDVNVYFNVIYKIEIGVAFFFVRGKEVVFYCLFLAYFVLWENYK